MSHGQSLSVKHLGDALATSLRASPLLRASCETRYLRNLPQLCGSLIRRRSLKK